MSMKQESIDSKISEIDDGWDTKCRCFNCLMKESKEKRNLFKGLLKEVFEEWLKQNPQMGSSTYYSGINTEIKHRNQQLKSTPKSTTESNAEINN